MKTRTISDLEFLAAIRDATRIRGEVEGCEWTIGASRWDVAAVLAGDPDSVGTSPCDYPDVPEQAVLTKAQSLLDRGQIDGCACGCRGDFTVRQA